MSRTLSMTAGLVLIFLGTQLFLVKSYLLTPSASQFMAEHFNSNNESRFALPNLQANNNGGQSFLTPQSGTQFNSGYNGNAGYTGNGAFNNASSQFDGGSLNSYPGQSWPYYRSQGGTGNSFSAPANDGGLFQNGTFSTPGVESSGFNATTNGFNSGAIGQVANTGYFTGTDGLLRKRFVPPQWIMWPALFLGVVLFLHGAALRR